MDAAAGAEAPAGWICLQGSHQPRQTYAARRSPWKLSSFALRRFTPIRSVVSPAAYDHLRNHVESSSGPLHSAQKSVKGTCLEVEESRDLTPHLRLSLRCVVDLPGIEPGSAILQVTPIYGNHCIITRFCSLSAIADFYVVTDVRKNTWCLQKFNELAACIVFLRIFYDLLEEGLDIGAGRSFKILTLRVHELSMERVRPIQHLFRNIGLGFVEKFVDFHVVIISQVQRQASSGGSSSPANGQSGSWLILPSLHGSPHAGQKPSLGSSGGVRSGCGCPIIVSSLEKPYVIQQLPKGQCFIKTGPSLDDAVHIGPKPWALFLEFLLRFCLSLFPPSFDVLD